MKNQESTQQRIESLRELKDRYRKLFAAGLITEKELIDVIVTMKYDSKLRS